MNQQEALSFLRQCMPSVSWQVEKVDQSSTSYIGDKQLHESHHIYRLTICIVATPEDDFDVCYWFDNKSENAAHLNNCLSRVEEAVVLLALHLRSHSIDVMPSLPTAGQMVREALRNAVNFHLAEVHDGLTVSYDTTTDLDKLAEAILAKVTRNQPNIIYVNGRRALRVFIDAEEHIIESRGIDKTWASMRPYKQERWFKKSLAKRLDWAVRVPWRD